MSSLVFTFFLLAAHAAAVSAIANPDSLRHQAALLSAQGNLDSALALVEKAAPALPDAWAGLLRGKLELSGDSARKAFEFAAKDSLHDDLPRGEAIFRLAQLYYASSQYRKAIPKFREYLSSYPRGPSRDPAAYWMAHACLQLAQQQSSQKSYLDSGLNHLDRLEAGNRPNGYYLPLALAARARILLARGNPNDTGAALKALEEARRRAPPEEMPGTLLLSARALPPSRADTAQLWEDSVLWEFPSSPEASLWMSHFSRTSIPSSLPSRKAIPSWPSRQYSLQLGNFSISRNAEQMRKRLAAKRIHTRIEKKNTGENKMFSVLFGIFPDTAAAQKQGKRLFKHSAYPFRVIPVSP